MLRTAAYVMTALVLIALGIAAKQGWFGDAEQTARNEAALPVIAPAPEGTITESVMPSSGTQLHGSSSAKSVQAPAQSAVSMHSPGPESANPVTAPHDHGSESQSPTFTDAEASDPDAVIGRPFPVSASVESLCRSHGKGAPCEEVLQLLSTMAQEPRDPAWASNTEAKLRALILAEPNLFTIRAIECRMSLCSVEVASIFGPYFGNLDADASLDKSLMRWFGMTGYETDPSSARVTVTLLMFKRR